MDDPGPSLLDPLQGKPKDWFSFITIVRSDVQRRYFATDEAYIAEQEVIARSESVKSFLEKFGIRVNIVVADEFLSENLRKDRPDLCINFVDTVHGSGPQCSGIPTIFDLLNIPYVGTGTLALSINSNKFLTKNLLEAWEIPTPQYQLIRSINQDLDYDLRFPLIVKLNEEHGSVGIAQNSVVTNEAELRERAKFLIDTYKQPVLVEEFIENGRELTAVVLEAKQTKVFLSERKFDAPPDAQFKLITFETKWATDLGKEEPVDYLPFLTENKRLINEIKQDVRKAFEILKMDDFGRFDIILDKYDNHYIVDCNTNPSLGPESSVARAAQANHQKFETILLNILQRNKLDHP